MYKQEQYLKYIADKYYESFDRQGHASAGHNGPHGHPDTPVRNTAHFVIIYMYLYKKYRDTKYLNISQKFVAYLCSKQKESKSGAIQCMYGGSFDNINGLIGQAWVIESLLYYYEIIQDKEVLETAKKIFLSQKYNWEQHLWHRIELDGKDIDIDPTSNHQVWFAACSYKLIKYCEDEYIHSILSDFVANGENTILHVHNDGLLKHNVSCKHPIIRKLKLRILIKRFLFFLKFWKPKTFDYKYIEYGYHIFDLYGLSIIKEQDPSLPLFKNTAYNKAINLAINMERLDRMNASNSKTPNIYYYTYNSPAFEWPYVALVNGFYNKEETNILYESQYNITFDSESQEFSKNNPDIITWNARTYEIIRFLEAKYN